MLSKIISIFTGGLTNSIEKIALEYIDTDKESAEAKSMLVKTLDPNGLIIKSLWVLLSLYYSIIVYGSFSDW